MFSLPTFHIFNAIWVRWEPRIGTIETQAVSYEEGGNVGPTELIPYCSLHFLLMLQFISMLLLFNRKPQQIAHV
jgi:hypothetical protein